MWKYNEELVKAGVMPAGEGLLASSKGVRVKFSEGKRTVIDGPFTETKELIAGFWLWQVRSMEGALRSTEEPRSKFAECLRRRTSALRPLPRSRSGTSVCARSCRGRQRSRSRGAPRRCSGCN